MAGNQEAKQRGIHDNSKGFSNRHLDNRIYRFHNLCDYDTDENPVKPKNRTQPRRKNQSKGKIQPDLKNKSNWD
jgi:hypothetical protein